jgi:hypothetical protein
LIKSIIMLIWYLIYTVDLAYIHLVNDFKAIYQPSTEYLIL